MQQPQSQQPVSYGLPMNSAPVPVLLNTPPQRGLREKYHFKSVKVLSILQILLGSLAIVLQIWDIVNHSWASVVGAGIWTGILFIIAGGLGVLSSNTRTTCAITSFLVMSIIASVFTIGLLVPSAINVGISNDQKQRYYHNYDNDYGYEYHYRGKNIPTLDMITGINAILILISLAQAVIAVVSSCYACHGLCCNTTQQGSVLIQGQVQYIPVPNGQTHMVIIPMPNQANVMTANPPYQLTTPIGGFQTQPLAAPQGEMPAGHGMPLGIPQLHQAQAAAPPQPPTYSGPITPPPEYEEKERGLQAEGTK